MSTASKLRVTGAPIRVQARNRAGLPRAASCCAAICLILTGCSQNGELAPVNWWHDLEGGRVAQDRPPPPNSNAPFPSLGTVPNRPAVIDAATRGRIANALVADRANAQYTDSLSPLPAAISATKPSTPAQPQPATAADSTMSASLPAASAPPQPPRPAPVAAVAATPLPAPTPAPATAGSAPTTNATPATATADSTTPLPPIPAAPPPTPTIGGVPAVTAPTPPPPTPPVVTPPTPVVPGAPVTIAFPAGSAELPTAGLSALRGLAARRGPGSIAVTGYGDAASSDPTAQSAAMPLAWDRAQAIARALLVAGVPSTSLRIASEASGRGGVARIVN